MKRIFTFKGISKQGYSIAGAGICNMEDIGLAAAAFENIDGADMEIRDINNPYLIDKVLFERISDICPKNVFAIGATVNIPEASERTGGILGNPFYEPDSADGLGENIGNGLSVAALPGGPGIIIEGDCRMAEEIVLIGKSGKRGNMTIKKLLCALKERNVELAIIVTDGSGSHDGGQVAVYEKGETLYLNTEK